MATQTTGGGSTTSFTNTPQAKDDNYAFMRTAPAECLLYNDTTKIITLDVMSNDLGGNAKTLSGRGRRRQPDHRRLRPARQGRQRRWHVELECTPAAPSASIMANRICDRR
jgi:hypothetical protein